MRLFIALMLCCSVAFAEGDEHLYKKRDRTLTDVFKEFSSSIDQAPIVHASTEFLNVSSFAGSCPSMTVHAAIVGADIPLDSFFCNGAVAGALSAAGYALLVVATYFAFRVAFL